MRRSPRPAVRSVAIIILTGVLLFSTAAPAFAAMSHAMVMYRAEKWAALKIPYSQSAYRTFEGVSTGYSSGWRTDCSGFVSMSWNTFRPGYSTRTLKQTANQITKEQLRPGDALVAYDYHAVIFGGWADAEHTEFWEYQMGSSVGPGDGTGIRIENYPGSSPPGKPYIPYRLKGITGYIDYPAFTEPVQGSSRYSTAVAASRSAFATGTVDTVIIASGSNWPDALGASALAGAVDGPVLLTAPGSLPYEVLVEISRLGAHEAIVVGGVPAVSEAVFSALDGLSSVTATRLAGDDRYSTAAAIANETARRLDVDGDYDGTVFITTGANFPDALAASPLAAKSGWPIILTETATLSDEASAAIAAIGAETAIILGGTPAVGAPVATALGSMLGTGNVARLAGPNRYDTALRIADYGRTECGLGLTSLAIATGTNYPDGLAGGVMAGRNGSVLLLTPPEWLDSDVKSLLAANKAGIGKPRILGGPLAVTPMAREQIALALGARVQ